jgi:hypothetical protein
MRYDRFWGEFKTGWKWQETQAWGSQGRRVLCSSTRATNILKEGAWLGSALEALLDAGTISKDEFDRLKAKALS